MKKYYKIIFILILFFISCGNLVNPTKKNYYYYKNENHTTTENQPSGNIEDGTDKVDPSKDPFIKGEWNNQNYKFDGSLIKNYFFGASFDSQNVPIYKFFLDYQRAWETEDINYKGYKYDGSGDGNKAQGFNISPANFYKYEGINPLVLYNSSYNKSDRMKRFIFYRLQGKAVIVPLNNYLIAVDTYSKFVFAYGKITKTESALGQHYPTEFQAVELHGEKRKFYEYDPIGVMIYDNNSKELKLNLYEEYKNEMAKNANAFFPSIHDTSRGLASENKAGLSPYYVSDSLSEVSIDNITITAKSLKNISVKSREKLFGIQGSPKDYAWFTYTISGISSILNNDIGVSEELQNLVNVDPASSSLTGMIFLTETKQIKINEEIRFSSKNSYKIGDIKHKGGYIELASRVDKYNKETGFADTAKFGSHGSGKMATKDSPKVRLKYDSSKKAFVIDRGSVNENRDTSVSITYDKNFTLKRGESKNFTIKYNWKKGNDTTNGEEFEITYNLEFKSVS